MAHILVVDDDQQLRDICKRSLIHAGYEVTTVSDGKKAIESIKSTTYDLILTDVFMPEVDGLGLLIYIGANCPDLKSILMTGGPTDFDVGEVYLDNAIDFGASVILRKPFEVVDLEEAVNKILSG